MIRYDEQHFLVPGAFQNHIHHLARDENHQPRVQWYLPVAERDKSQQGNGAIYIDEQMADGQVRVFGNDGRNNVGAARCGLRLEHNGQPDADDGCAEHRCQQQVVGKAERVVFTDEGRERIHKHCRGDEAQHRFEAEAWPQNLRTDNGQNGVEASRHKTDWRAVGEQVEQAFGGVVNDDGDAVNTARHNLVGVDEQHKTQRQHKCAHQNIDDRLCRVAPRAAACQLV